jgi:hypothetical protein
MQRNKLILIVCVVFVLASFFIIINKNKKEPKIVVEEKTATTTPVEIKKEKEVVSVKDMAWSVFQKYLGYNKSHDLDGVKSVVLKVNEVCSSSTITDECKNRMDSAYSYGSAFKKADFKNVLNDGKQITLATDFKIDEDANLIGRNRAIIYFVKNDAGNWVLFSFSPFKGATLPKTASTTREDLIKQLITLTEDKN